MESKELSGIQSSNCIKMEKHRLRVSALSLDLYEFHLAKGEQQTEQYAKLNPMKSVPTFIVDGDHAIAQSLAIIEYLEETHAEPSLLPKDPYARAISRQIALMIAADIHPLQNLKVLKMYSDVQEKRAEWVKHWITQGFVAVEQIIAKHCGKYCVGDQVTIADICLVPQVYNARRWNVHLEPFPTIARIAEQLKELPAFKAASPEEQSDYEPQP